ncbi:hypothetical protein CSOJ01_14344 [Colletotrichum sojae]|uniref:Uncharacterized protein n=1 Tax=Colletotrichum sojae TaxID=2175907 RepID=A0A8H6IQU7_9PEZI|nr:hypothetical protein CSOJ01_14344 [Colletotrichum sojae]
MGERQFVRSLAPAVVSTISADNAAGTPVLSAIKTPLRCREWERLRPMWDLLAGPKPTAKTKGRWTTDAEIISNQFSHHNLLSLSAENVTFR